MYINAAVLNRYASRKLCLFRSYLFDRNIAKTWRVRAYPIYGNLCYKRAMSTRGRSKGLNLASVDIPPSRTEQR